MYVYTQYCSDTTLLIICVPDLQVQQSLHMSEYCKFVSLQFHVRSACMYQVIASNFIAHMSNHITYNYVP